MPIHSPSPPLFSGVRFDRHCLVDTTDIEEARQRIAQWLNPHQLHMLAREQGLHSRMAALRCGGVSLIRLSWGADVSVDPDCLDSYYLLVLPIRGQAQFQFDGRSIEVSPKAAVIISPLRRFLFKANRDYEQIILRLDQRAVQEAWCRLTADDTAPPICFDSVIPLQGQGWQALLPTLQWVARCSGMDEAQAQAKSALLGQVETQLATTLLMHQPHTMAARLWPQPPPASPAAVRRAQSYMRAHLGEGVPISMVASHSGVSVRHLQALFQQACGQSPLQWLRWQRLQAVRQALLSDGDHPRPIGEIAMRFGFTHLGEFSAAYRQAYGETPRQTRGKHQD